MSDVDIAVYYQASAEERFRFRMKVAGSLGDRYDVHIVQDLPFHVKKGYVERGKNRNLPYDIG